MQRRDGPRVGAQRIHRPDISRCEDLGAWENDAAAAVEIDLLMDDLSDNSHCNTGDQPALGAEEPFAMANYFRHMLYLQKL